MTLTDTKLSKSTQAVLEALQQLNHVTAPEIQIWINQVSQGKKISLTSVYRALTHLTAEGKVKPLNFNDGQIRYELNTAQMHHHHLICTHCERVQMLDDCPFDALIRKIDGQFQVEYHNFEVFGRCHACLSTH